jgi:DNA invertase Pin-like site-specific DNA recombinase
MTRKPNLARHLQPATARERAARGLDQPPGRVFGYVRVSSDEQAESGQSLAVQEQQLRGWAMQRGRTIEQVAIEPGVSGGIPFGERPEGGRLWGMVQRGDTVVASKLDRMFRSASDCLDVVDSFKRAGVSLYLLDLNGGADDVSGNGIARLFLTIVSAFAEFERDRIGERIREAKRKNKAEGAFMGGRSPLGFDKVATGEVNAKTGRPRHRLVANAEQQATLRRIREMHAAGDSSRRISAKLAEMGFKLSHISVQKILKTERGA